MYLTIFSISLNLYLIVERSDAVEGCGSGYGFLYCSLLSRNLPGRTEENHEDPNGKIISVPTGNVLVAVCCLNQLARCNKKDNGHDCFMCYCHHCIYRKLHAWWRCPPCPITLPTMLYALLTSVTLSDVCVCEIFRAVRMYAVKVIHYICNRTAVCLQKDYPLPWNTLRILLKQDPLALNSVIKHACNSD